MTERERRKIARRFTAIFEGVPHDRLAQMLGCSERTVTRIMRGENTPNMDLAANLEKLCDEVNAEAILTPAEKLERDERRRAENESRQRKIPLISIDGHEEKEIPAWYARVRSLMDNREFSEAYELSYDRVHDPNDFRYIPEKTKAYVLGSFAVCCYYTGRLIEAKEFYEKALKAGRKRNDISPKFLASYTSNLGLVHMRLHAFEKAYQAFDDALAIDRTFVEGYYNALCAASQAREIEQLSLWLGRLIQEASATLTRDDIISVVDFYSQDDDLVWAREKPVFNEAMKALREMATADK